MGRIATVRNWIGHTIAASPPVDNTGGVMDGDDSFSSLGAMSGGRNAAPTPLATAFSIINLLATTQGALPRSVHEREDLSRRKVSDPRYKFLFGSPNVDWRTASVAWWTMAFAHNEGWRNSFYWRRRVGQSNVVRGLDILHPRSVRVKRIDGKKQFTLAADQHQKVYGPDDILHLHGLSFDGVKGVSPVEAGLASHELSLIQEKWVRSFLKRGPSTSVVVTVAPEAKISEELIDKFYKDWDKRHGGLENKGGPLLVQGGTNARSLIIPMEDAQMLQSRQYSREEVLGFYAPGLPHHLLGWKSNTSNFGTGIEAQSRHLVQFVLLSRLALFADGMSLELLPPELELEFRVAHLLKGDMKTQAEVYWKMRQGKALSAEQWRAEVGMIPRGIPDEYVLSKNMDQFPAEGDGGMMALPAEADPPDDPESDENPALSAGLGRIPGEEPLATGLRCQNAACDSRSDGKVGALLTQGTGDEVAICRMCGETTEIPRAMVIRDDGDYAEAVLKILFQDSD